MAALQAGKRHEQMSGGWDALPWSGLPREEGQRWEAAGDEVGPDPHGHVP